MAGKMLEQNQVTDYMVEIGGEIALKGNSPSGKKWRISIDTPLYENNLSHDSFTIIEVTDCGIATSGNYRNFKESKEGKFGHTISPVTGFPIQTEIISATIIAPTAMEADAVATACMASTLSEAQKLIEILNLDGFFILSDFSSWMNEGFSAKVSAPGKISRN